MAVGSTYEALKLPSHIKTILITGAGGYVGQELTKLILKLYPEIRLIATDVQAPPAFVDDEKRLKPVKADLGNPEDVKRLFEGETIGGVFALHGIMSGGSEANFDLGWRVNVDSHVSLLKTTYAHAQSTNQTGNTKPLYVFVSGLAVYGGPRCLPEHYVVPSETPLLPQTSYGIQKNVTELYVLDYGRKGYLDTRAVRLPTVAIRNGAPSSAASSFISGLIREPMQGERSTCPIADSADDPIMDNMPVYLSRTRTVIRNIVWAMCMPEKNFKAGEGRSINIPGIKVIPRQIIEALVEHGGKDKLELVDYKRDQAVINICSTWPGEFDTSEAEAMGFEVDDKKTGFADAVGDFKAELKEAGKL